MYKRNRNNQEGEIQRIRTPRDNEVLGVVESRLGFGKMRIICADKKIRICRVPGRFKRRLWVKVNFIVIVKPWEIQGDKKGDIIYVYRKAQVEWLRNKGFLEKLEV
jgi:translation initiation factor 1A